MIEHLVRKNPGSEENIKILKEGIQEKAIIIITGRCSVSCDAGQKVSLGLETEL